MNSIIYDKVIFKKYHF